MGVSSLFAELTGNHSFCCDLNLTYLRLPFDLNLVQVRFIDHCLLWYHSCNRYLCTFSLGRLCTALSCSALFCSNDQDIVN